MFFVHFYKTYKSYIFEGSEDMILLYCLFLKKMLNVPYKYSEFY